MLSTPEANAGIAVLGDGVSQDTAFEGLTQVVTVLRSRGSSMNRQHVRAVVVAGACCNTMLAELWSWWLVLLAFGAWHHLE